MCDYSAHCNTIPRTISDHSKKKISWFLRYIDSVQNRPFLDNCKECIVYTISCLKQKPFQQKPSTQENQELNFIIF